MAKVEHTLDAPVLIGIDISKHRHEVLIAIPGKTRRRRLTITNTLEDFHRLVVPRPGFETALCAGHAASLNLVAALVSRAFCSARI